MNSSDLISVFYLIVSIGVIREIIKTRKSLLDDIITPRDRRIVTQAAFFFLIPPGVLLHELGHSFTTLLFGGKVAEFHWMIYWGYIVPKGNFTPLQNWWISLSGNLVSVIYGLIPLIFLGKIKKPIVKELIRSFIKLEIIFSLICYPLFSFVLVGDWVEIYNFSIKPYSQITLVIHLLLLFVLWKSGVIGERKTAYL